MWVVGGQSTEAKHCGNNNMVANLEDEGVESQSVISEDSNSYYSIKNNSRKTFQLNSKVGSSV
jgi:hypothetical protein